MKPKTMPGLVVLGCLLSSLGSQPCAAQSGAATSRPTCSAIVVEPGRARSQLNQIDARWMETIGNICRFSPFPLDRMPNESEPNTDADAISRATRLYDDAREAYLKVRFPAAADLALQAISLMETHHAGLDSQDPLSAAYTFLGVVLWADQKHQQARDAFRHVVTRTPDYQPDPASVPPGALALFADTRKELLALSPGAGRIWTEPAGAEILLDGRRQEAVTPLLMDGLLPGNHLILLRHPACQNWTGTLVVAPGQTRQLNVSLEPNLLGGLLRQPDKELARMLAMIGPRQLPDWIILIHPEAGDSGPDAKASIRIFHTRSGRLEPSRPLRSLLPAQSAPEPQQQPVARAAPAPVVDLTSPRSESSAERGSSVFESWWFWTMVGAVAVSAAVVIPVMAHADDDGLTITVDLPH